MYNLQALPKMQLMPGLLELCKLLDHERIPRWVSSIHLTPTHLGRLPEPQKAWQIIQQSWRQTRKLQSVEGVLRYKYGHYPSNAVYCVIYDRIYHEEVDQEGSAIG